MLIDYHNENPPKRKIGLKWGYKKFTSFLEKMKNFWTKFSVTKLVFLLMSLCLIFQAIYLTINGVETSLFNNCMLSVIAFYFGQKVGKAQADPLIDNETENDKI